MSCVNQHADLHLQQLQLNIKFLLFHLNKHPRLSYKREISNLLQRTKSHIESMLPYVKNNFQLEIYIARLLTTILVATRRLCSQTDQGTEDTFETYDNSQEALDKHNRETAKIISRFFSTNKLSTELHILQASHKSLMVKTSQSREEPFTSLLKMRARILFYILEAIAHTQNAVSQLQIVSQSQLQDKSVIEQRKALWGHRQRSKVMAPSSRIPTNVFLMRF